MFDSNLIEVLPILILCGLEYHAQIYTNRIFVFVTIKTWVAQTQDFKAILHTWPRVVRIHNLTLLVVKIGSPKTLTKRSSHHFLKAHENSRLSCSRLNYCLDW